MVHERTKINSKNLTYEKGTTTHWPSLKDRTYYRVQVWENRVVVREYEVSRIEYELLKKTSK